MGLIAAHWNAGRHWMTCVVYCLVAPAFLQHDHLLKDLLYSLPSVPDLLGLALQNQIVAVLVVLVVRGDLALV